jgi:hypothetical protein
MTSLRRVNLIFAVMAVMTPVAHVLELPNKLALDGPLWLAVQQHLYRGWGPFIGAPAEIGALATALVLLVLRRGNSATRRLTLVAAISYGGMLAAFFLCNAPVNAAVNRWTPATLPADWARYRLRWEAGHAIAALLSASGLAALVRCRLAEA